MRPLLLLSLLLGQVLAAPTPAVLAARSSTVQILRLEPDGQYHAICTGANVRLKSGVRILTAGHCVDGGKGRYRALSESGRVWPLSLERWELEWPKSDFATFAGEVTRALPALELNLATPVAGQSMYTWAGPLGLSPLYFEGFYSGLVHFPTEDDASTREVEGMPFVSINATHGSSGSSVLDASGRVVGILVGMFGEVKLYGALLAPVPH